MQSRGKVKRICDYAVGERVYDGDLSIGRVAAIDQHPDKSSVGYLLIEDDGHYTTMRGSMDVRQWLCVARRIPESVAMYFAEVVLGKDVEPRVMKRKFPVVEDKLVEDVVEDIGEEIAKNSGLAPMPYIDAV